MKKRAIFLILIAFLLIASYSFGATLFLTENFRAVYYNNFSYVNGTYTSIPNGKYPTTVINYYIAPNIKDVFNVSDPEFLKSFILLGNGSKFFKDPKNGPSLSKNIYDLLNVGDSVYKVKWKEFPKVFEKKIEFPKSFTLMDIIKFVNIIQFPIYTEDLLRDYIATNGGTTTIFESKPKFKLTINKSDYINLPVSLRVSGDCKSVLWNINGKTFTDNYLSFVSTKSDYEIKLTVTGELGTSSSTSIQMHFKRLLTYEYTEGNIKNTFKLKGSWYIPFFNTSGNSTITYNGKVSFLAFEYLKNKTIVHRFTMNDSLGPEVVDNCNHKFYENEPFEVNFEFYDNSGINERILLNGKRVKNHQTMNLSYGKYTLTVLATDNFGNSTRYATAISVLDTIPPIVRIKNYTVNEKEKFYLDGSECTDNGTIISYKWIVNKKIFYGKRVSISLSKSGVYNASLIVVDDSLNSSVGNFTITVKDNIPPLLIFSSTTITASPNETLSLSPFMASDDSGKVSIIWVMQSPKVFHIGKNFNYKFKNPGTYNINVIAQDSYHNQTMVRLTIIIK